MGTIVCSLVTVQGIVLRTSSAISFDHHKKGPEEGLSCDLLDGAVLGDWSQHRAGYQRGCTASCFSPQACVWIQTGEKETAD